MQRILLDTARPWQVATRTGDVQGVAAPTDGKRPITADAYVSWGQEHFPKEWVQSCCQGLRAPLWPLPGEGNGPHSSILAWKIPWAEEPGRLQSMGSQPVGHDWVTSLWLFTLMHWRRKWQPTPVFLPGESRDGGAWRAAVYGVAQSRTRLKRLLGGSSSGPSLSQSHRCCTRSQGGHSGLCLKVGRCHRKSWSRKVTWPDCKIYRARVFISFVH